jgi:FKBP-type peptidyl-prolyl cis-trans isomerase SlyD
MKIAQDSVVSFLYTLKDAVGAIIDQSDGEPLAYLHGHGQIVPGLERELTGKSTGEKLQVHVQPADAYGEYDASQVVKVPRTALAGIPDLQEGMTLTARTRDGGRAQVLVREIGPDAVTVDGNHPLAGKDLFFDIEIVEVRAASQEELEHGHVHGLGGHDH